MNRVLLASVFGVSVSLISGLAAAHVAVASGPGFADTTQEVTFGIGHGCEGLDTYSIKIEIPTDVLSVRAIDSLLGPANVVTDESGLVTSVTWTKPAISEDVRDVEYHKVALRLRVPNQPFSTLYFPTRQICRDALGVETVVDWISTDPESEAEPAPGLTILPKRFAGWNKFTIGAAISDLSVFFSDALIVWKDDAAYSMNPLTTELIAETEDVTALTELEAGDEIWVKY
jgi:periplasmic copper chaperone A